MATKSQIIHKKIKSSYLKKLVYYTLYIPKDIEENKNYPSLYLLHGIEGDYTDWEIKGEIQKTVASLIKQERLTKLFIIMPDGFKTFYSNAYDNSENYEDYFIKELIPKIESSYPIIRNRKFRAIGGLSMGGFGAVKLILKFPELFSIAFSHSGAFFREPDPHKTTVESVALAFHKIFGDPYNKKHWENNNPFSLLNKKRSNLNVALYLDCGKDDRIFHLSEDMHKFLNEKSIQHVYNIFEGEHSWDYWRIHIKDSLLFLNDYIKT